MFSYESYLLPEVVHLYSALRARGRDGPLRPTGRCVQSWVAHHGVRGRAPEENFAYTTIFRAKNACSENVKHLVQKLSSRDLHESGHTA